MNTPHSNKKKGRNRMGMQNESASPTNAETLSSQEMAKFVLVRLNKDLADVSLFYF